MNKTVGYEIDCEKLPDKFPTHKHSPCFWESLGRAVATFSFLEEILKKAIFAFTTTKPYNENEIQLAYEKWQKELKTSLTDPLRNLVEAYGKAVRKHPDAKIKKFDDFLAKLKKAPTMRNVICHGSWRPPDVNGKSVPFFVNYNLDVFATSVDTQFLDQVQKHTAELACAVINSVIFMGWQFPGSNGPGESIWWKNQ